jgi:hypothetical protein
VALTVRARAQVAAEAPLLAHLTRALEGVVAAERSLTGGGQVTRRRHLCARSPGVKAAVACVRACV